MGLFSSAKKDTQIGVDFLPDGVALAQVLTSKKMPGQVLRSEFVAASGQQAQADALKSWVRDNGLHKIPCVCVVANSDCDVFQVERPEVEAGEMIQAVTWKIKDLINYDIASAVVDSYLMPVSSKNNQKQVGVVVAKESVISDYVEIIQASTLKLVALDIQELVRSNLQLVKHNSEQSIAVLSLSQNNGLLSIYHDADLYVSRDFKLGIKQLELVTSEDQSAFDSILLEVQRSLDYFESYYGMGSVAQLYIAPRVMITEKMAMYLQNLTNLDINFIDFPAAEPAAELDPNCFHAYCAALRGVAL